MRSHISAIQALGGEKPIELYFIGESNSGGNAANGDATAGEIDVDSNIQILNNTSLVFADLKIDGNTASGKNNLIDHAALSNEDSTHGWELQLGNSTAGLNPPVYLIKCGQGGSRLSQWSVDGTYDTKFKARVSAAKSALLASTINTKKYVWMSIGLNDKSDGLNADTWYTQLIEWVPRVQAETNATKILMTQFDFFNMGAYNTKMADAAAAIPYLEVIDTTGATVSGNHWTYAGLKVVTNEFISNL